MEKSSCSRSPSLIRTAPGSADMSYRKHKLIKSSSSNSCAIPREFAGLKYTSKSSQPPSLLCCARNARHTTLSPKQVPASTTRSSQPMTSLKACGGRSAVGRSMSLVILYSSRWTTQMAARRDSMFHTNGTRAKSTISLSLTNTQQ